MKRRPLFHIIHARRVPEWVVGLHGAFAEWLLRYSKPRHPLVIYLYPRTSIPTDDGRQCLGFFNPNSLEIGLACWSSLPRYPYADRVYSLLDTFAHEYTHYEQFRDGRAQGHRGVKARAAAMCRRFEVEFLSEKKP